MHGFGMDLLIAGRRMKAFWLIFWIFLKIARVPMVVQGSLRNFMLKARKAPDQGLPGLCEQPEYRPDGEENSK